MNHISIPPMTSGSPATVQLLSPVPCTYIRRCWQGLHLVHELRRLSSVNPQWASQCHPTQRDYQISDMYIPFVLKHSLLSIVCGFMFGVCMYVLMSVSMLCANGWETPTLKGTFCL